MKTLLSGTDTLKLFEMLLKHPLPDVNEQESILSKLKLSLIESLSHLDNVRKESNYKDWLESENKRIDELKQELAAVSL
jgi:hypothetical protein